MCSAEEMIVFKNEIKYYAEYVKRSNTASIIASGVTTQGTTIASKFGKTSRRASRVVKVGREVTIRCRKGLETQKEIE